MSYKKISKYLQKMFLLHKQINYHVGGGNEEDKRAREVLAPKIDEIFNFYSAKLVLTIEERLKKFNKGFNELLDLCKKYCKEDAIIYYSLRNKEEDIFERVQTKVLTKLQDTFSKYSNISIHKTSSFAAGTYVLGESDIDFTICVKSDMKTEELADYYKKIGDEILIPLGYTYSKMYNKTAPREVYQIFTKYVDGIEIEAKIRDYDAFEPILKYHDYMNNECPDEKKIYITYIKYLFSKPTKLPQYSNFKWIMMEFGLYNAGIMKVFGKIGLSD